MSHRQPERSAVSPVEGSRVGAQRACECNCGHRGSAGARARGQPRPQSNRSVERYRSPRSGAMKTTVASGSSAARSSAIAAAPPELMPSSRPSSRASARHLDGTLARHGADLVHRARVEDRRQVLRRPGADAGDLASWRGLHAHDAHAIGERLERARRARDGSRGAHRAHHVGDGSGGLLPDLGAGGCDVRSRVARVGELIESHRARRCGDLLGDVARAPCRAHGRSRSPWPRRPAFTGCAPGTSPRAARA